MESRTLSGILVVPASKQFTLFRTAVGVQVAKYKTPADMSMFLTNPMPRLDIMGTLFPSTL